VGGVGHGQAPDVEGLGLLRVALGGHVDPAEAQRLVADVELGQASEAGPHHDVALGSGLERPAPAEIEHGLEHPLGVGPHGVEASVSAIEELLFLFELRLSCHLAPSFAGPGAKRETVQSIGWTTGPGVANSAGDGRPGGVRGVVPTPVGCEDLAGSRIEGEPCSFPP
jgi:hypothetical protein